MFHINLLCFAIQHHGGSFANEHELDNHIQRFGPSIASHVDVDLLNNRQMRQIRQIVMQAASGSAVERPDHGEQPVDAGAGLHDRSRTAGHEAVASKPNEQAAAHIGGRDGAKRRAISLEPDYNTKVQRVGDFRMAHAHGKSDLAASSCKQQSIPMPMPESNMAPPLGEEQRMRPVGEGAVAPSPMTPGYLKIDSGSTQKEGAPVVILKCYVCNEIMPCVGQCTHVVTEHLATHCDKPVADIRWIRCRIGQCNLVFHEDETLAIVQHIQECRG